MFRCALFLALVVVVHSACDNQCSGHGTCGTDDVCTCYDNWGVGLSHDTGDCSDRICPYELAWVDKPDNAGTFHKYAECAGRGVCARDTGTCVCFAGYEGKACQRMSCPNGCSGHGTCEFIEDFSYGATWNEYLPATAYDAVSNYIPSAYSQVFDYHRWDRMKTRACKCDARFGDFDCSKRMCPYGNDVLDNREFVLVSARHQTQRIVFAAADKAGETGPAPYTPLASNMDGNSPAAAQTFALTFKSRLNETFTTTPIVMASLDVTHLPKLSNDVKLALLKLPNGVVDGVSVTSSLSGSSSIVLIDVTFTGAAVEGPQHLLQVENTKCTAPGCTPMITGLPVQTVVSVLQSTNAGQGDVAEYTPADYHSYECGRRGKCDYTTGLCACFTGYTGENCNTLTTLV